MYSSAKLRDYNLSTCEIFDGCNTPFIYLWVYTGGTLGPLNVHVIGNSSCWPQMTLHVMRMDSDGRMEHCYPRKEQVIQSNYYKGCPHYCRCEKCDNYIIIKLPMGMDNIVGSVAICEIVFR